MSAPDDQLRLQATGDGAAAARAPAIDTRGLHLAVLVAALLVLMGMYHETVASLVDIWNRSDTFAHGFVVAPISCWLIWRERERLRSVPLTPSWVGLITGVIAGFAWLLGELASVTSVSQFALVGMVIALVWSVAGTQFVRAIAFPLGFLFFLVPFGEFLFPTMMDWTTDFVVGGLRLSGVPVYAEGRNLVIPSGQWSVVEGCSGVRYLIASAVVGSLYAYLTYRSLWRRIAFTSVSVVLPVFANWVRAYGIVMLAHVSDNRLAAGVDHIIYGWVFFGLVMLGLFWLGGRWREDERPVERVSMTSAETSHTAGARVAGWWIAATMAVLLTWRLVPGLLEVPGGSAPVTMPALSGQAGWAPSQRLPGWAPRYSGMRGEQRTLWASGDQAVGLHVAYYRAQGPGTELINSENRILQNKDPDWSQAAYGKRGVAVGSQMVEVRSTEIFNRERRLLVWNWYWVDGRWTSSDYVAKLYQTLGRLLRHGDDSAAVMVYAPVVDGERESAEAALASFVRDNGDELNDILKRAQAR